MGFNFKSLVDSFKKQNINLCETKTLQNYVNQTFAVDTSIYLYKYLANNNLSYLELFLKQILLFKKYSIKLIYVFEGKPPKEKNRTLIIRKNNKDKIKHEIDELILLKNKDDIDDETLILLESEIEKKKKKCINISSSHVDNLKLLFDYLNISYIDAPGEAEVFCVNLINNGIASACLSEDYDVLANGGRIFLKNLNLYKENVIEYDLNNILIKMNITHNQFIDICILTGCDYVSKIQKIGPILGYKLIQKHSNIENIIDFFKKNNKFEISEDFENNFNYARNLFICKVEYDYQNIIINNNNKYNFDKIKIFFKNNNISHSNQYINIIKSIKND